MHDIQPNAAAIPVGSEWTFLTPHALLLICILDHPQVRMRELAERVGLTERSVARIIRTLVGEGVISRRKFGRRNRYVVDSGVAARHALETKEALTRLADRIRPIAPPVDSPKSL